jgi:hypothetical protein
LLFSLTSTPPPALSGLPFSPSSTYLTPLQRRKSGSNEKTPEKSGRRSHRLSDRPGESKGRPSFKSRSRSADNTPEEVKKEGRPGNREATERPGNSEVEGTCLSEESRTESGGGQDRGREESKEREIPVLVVEPDLTDSPVSSGWGRREDGRKRETAWVGGWVGRSSREEKEKGGEERKAKMKRANTF